MFPRIWQGFDDVTGDHTARRLGARGIISGEAVQIDPEARGGTGQHALGEQSANQTSQNVASAAFGESGVAGGVDVDLAIGLGDNGAGAFQDQHATKGGRERRGPPRRDRTESR